MQVVLAGIDEVGRGALAGPVTVGAVALPFSTDEVMKELETVLGRPPADSKKLTAIQRKKAAEWLVKNFPSRVGFANRLEIDEQGIVQATSLAAGRALINLAVDFHQVVSDAGLRHPYEDRYPTEWFVRGDETVPAILCASIVAKVARDNCMTELAAAHPEYGWEQNKGYGSQAHCRAIQTHGASPEHRALFIRRILMDGARAA